MEDLGGFRAALLAWYEVHRRDLPWRRTKDPYAILVSEILLQQTRMTSAKSYFRRFMGRFPTLQALAEADTEEVLHVWEGLGYYRRARRLHAAAKEIVRTYGGRVPSHPDALRALPGVGPYTAGAVASIAYGHRAPAVDGNVTRVLARLFRIEVDVTRSSTKRLIRARAARLVPDREPGTFNQALMELGALVCQPKKPRCDACPVLPWCQARAARVETSLPRSGKVSAVPTVTAAFALLERHDQVLLVRRGEDELLGGLWALPGGEVAETESPEQGLRRLLHERHGVNVRPGSVIGHHLHTFSHKRWDAFALRCELESDPTPRSNQRWVQRGELGDLPLVPFHRAFLELGDSRSLEAFAPES